MAHRGRSRPRRLPDRPCGWGRGRSAITSHPRARAKRVRENDRREPASRHGEAAALGERGLVARESKLEEALTTVIQTRAKAIFTRRRKAAPSPPRIGPSAATRIFSRQQALLERRSSTKRQVGMVTLPKSASTSRAASSAGRKSQLLL